MMDWAAPRVRPRGRWPRLCVVTKNGLRYLAVDWRTSAECSPAKTASLPLFLSSRPTNCSLHSLLCDPEHVCSLPQGCLHQPLRQGWSCTDEVFSNDGSLLSPKLVSTDRCHIQPCAHNWIARSSGHLQKRELSLGRGVEFARGLEAFLALHCSLPQLEKLRALPNGIE
jgi:hypothetical protein